MGNDFSFLICELNHIMTEYCPRTGSSECKCEKKLVPTPIGNALLTDAKCGVRKLFADHEKYTNWFFISSFARLNDTQDVLNRLMENAAQITKFLSPLIDTEVNKDNSKLIHQLLIDHIGHAGKIVSVLMGKFKSTYADEVKALYVQGDKLSLALSRFIPNLNYEKIAHEFRTHNIYVANLAVSRHNNVSGKDYIALYDKYSDHMAKFADMLYYGLTMTN